MGEQTGWLIERHKNSELQYWNGRPRVAAEGLCQDHDAAWTTRHEEAVRFARAEDASIVLAWVLKGFGRVAEHRWVSAALNQGTQSPSSEES